MKPAKPTPKHCHNYSIYLVLFCEMRNLLFAFNNGIITKKEFELRLKNIKINHVRIEK